MKLGVNIDHIATLRQARGESFPDPVLASQEALAGGADGIVCHLREDRRHIQDADLIKLRKLNTRLDLEMAATKEMLKIALKIKPDMVTIVPEKRAELTTEGGLDVAKHARRLRPIVEALQKRGIKVSLFIDPIKKQLVESAGLMVDFIELHTGEYARKGRPAELEQLGMMTQEARLIGLKINAGHGLDYDNVHAVAEIPGIEELNIGFSIIARALSVGIKQAVKEMKELLK